MKFDLLNRKWNCNFQPVITFVRFKAVTLAWVSDECLFEALILTSKEVLAQVSLANRRPVFQTLVLTAAAGILFVTAGAILIEYWDITPDRFGISDLTLGAGILGIIIGAIYIADTVLSFKFD